MLIPVQLGFVISQDFGGQRLKIEEATEAEVDRAALRTSRLVFESRLMGASELQPVGID